MRHDWIFDVLTDLRKYAEKNDLAAIAAETGRMIEVARKELAEKFRAEQALGEDVRPPQMQPETRLDHKNTK